MVNTFSLYATLISQLIFCSSWLPQIRINYTGKSGKGVNAAFLFCLLNGYWANMYYVYALDLPLSYKIFGPISSFLVLITLGQKYWYNREKNAYMVPLFLLNVLIYMLLLPCAYAYPSIVGDSAGVVAVFMWGIYHIPQIIKVILARSVKGFSIRMVMLCFVGGLLELGGAYFLSLPWQTWFTIIRGLSTSCVYFSLFYLFSPGVSGRYFSVRDFRVQTTACSTVAILVGIYRFMF